jgi:hypothetical protein
LKPLARKVDDKQIVQLIGELDSDQFQRRSDATEKLTRMGEEAEPALKAALAGKSTLESRMRVEKILAAVQSHPFTTEQLRHLRALEVLQHINTSDARQVLQAIAQGAPGTLTTEASDALAQCLKVARDGR